MTKPYHPYLFGVSHHDGFEKPVIDAILKLKPKRVGLEIPEGAILKPNDYWFNIKRALESRGIEVVPLTIFAIFNRMKKIGKQKLAKKILEQDRSGKMNLETAILFDTLTRDIERHALRAKPDAIVVGAAHAAILRMDLNIPKEKYRQFLKPHFKLRFQMWLGLKHDPSKGMSGIRESRQWRLRVVKATRRLRRARAKQKEAFRRQRGFH